MKQLSSSYKKNSKILIIDDVVSALNVVKRILEKMGFEKVSCASSGTEALQQVNGHQYNLIISDLHLQDMKATDLYEKLTSSGLQKEALFVVMTSDMGKDEFKEALSKGVRHYLLKPFSAFALEEKLAFALAKENHKDKYM